MKTYIALALLLSLGACGSPGVDEVRENREALGFQCRDPNGEPGCFLTTSSDQDTFPSISGSRVVWSTVHEGRSRIYLRDFAVSGSAIEISPPNTWNVLPNIDGNRVVYVRVPPNFQPWQFIGLDLATGQETVYGTLPAEFGVVKHAVQGNRVVFSDYENGNWDIYMYDFTTNLLRRISTDPAEQYDSVIFGNRIAWTDRRAASAWYDLYVYDLTTNTEQRITQQTTLGRGPVLSADRVLWGDIRGGFFKLYEYVFAGAGAHEHLVPTKTLVENSLALSGNTVAWVNRNDDNPVFYDDVFVYDLATGAERRVTSNPARQWLPSLSLPYLVWEDSRRGNADVVIERLQPIWL